MIDIENEIITDVISALRGKYDDDIYVTGEPLSSIPTALPAVGIIATSNIEPRNKRDSSGKEKFANFVFQVSIYSNKTSGRKSQIKEIHALIDNVLRGHGFRRDNDDALYVINDGKIYVKPVRYVVQSDGKYTYGI